MATFFWLILGMAKARRDNFSIKTKWQLAQRVGFHCSLLECDAATFGPSDESGTAVSNVGVACHISAASSGPGSRRFDPNMTTEDRCSVSNGIWLCQTHAKLIDTDELRFTVLRLREIRLDAEARAKKRLGLPQMIEGSNQRPLDLELHSAGAVYMRQDRAVAVLAELSNPCEQANAIRKVEINIGGKTYKANRPRGSLIVEGFDWFPTQGLRLESWGAVEGAWYFGWSFDGGGEQIDAGPSEEIHLTVTPVRGDPVIVRLPLSHPNALRKQEKSPTVGGS